MGTEGEQKDGSSAKRYVIGGKYLLDREIARGAMGRVFLATQISLKRKVAVKVMSPSTGRNADFDKRFMLEARSVAGLSHHNIVTVHDYGRTKNGLLYMAMEFIDGPTIAQALKKMGGPFPVGRACNIVLQSARALRVAHRQGLVHRDIKPGNIMIVEDEDDGDHVKVLDFGLAKLFEEDRDEDADSPMTREGLMLGTPRYMAPEQIVGKEITPQTDIYSLGAVFYQLLTGRPAFSGASDVEILHSQLTGDPTPINDLEGCEDMPIELSLVVSKAMKREASDRFPDAQSFMDELRLAISHAISDPEYRTKLTEGGLPPGVLSSLPDVTHSVIDNALEISGDADENLTQPTAELEALVELEPMEMSEIVPITDVDTKRRGNPMMAAAVALLAVAILGFVGFQAYKHFSEETPVRAPTPAVGAVTRDPPKPKPTKTVEKVEEKQGPFKASVITQPDGLEILVDEGKVLGKTPTIVEVEDVRLVRFRLVGETMASEAFTLRSDAKEQRFDLSGYVEQVKKKRKAERYKKWKKKQEAAAGAAAKVDPPADPAP